MLHARAPHPLTNTMQGCFLGLETVSRRTLRVLERLGLVSVLSLERLEAKRLPRPPKRLGRRLSQSLFSLKF